jgi:hypothetical protein
VVDPNAAEGKTHLQGENPKDWQGVESMLRSEAAR